MPCPRAMSHAPCPGTSVAARPQLPPCTPLPPPPHPALVSLTQIVMPAELMAEPSNPNLYEDFARVATDLNVYTGVDCALPSPAPTRTHPPALNHRSPATTTHPPYQPLSHTITTRNFHPPTSTRPCQLPVPSGLRLPFPPPPPPAAAQTLRSSSTSTSSGRLARCQPTSHPIAL